MREIFLADGLYTTPAIGSTAVYPESSFGVDDGQLHLNSALFDERRSFSNIFSDPRTVNLVDAVVRHQIHLLDVRQLSAPEDFETREGAGRMNRLTTLVESAAMGAKLGATFEQVAQVMLSDINVTVDSHRLGDHLVDDYATESARDSEVAGYVRRSGLFDYLVQRGALQPDGYLVDSPVNIYEIAYPKDPRRNDIVECERPDGNLDRIPFTLFEGLYLVDQKTIVEAVNSVIRVEVKGENGQTEERLACSEVEAARLIYQLSVRHLAEHWGDPLHQVVTELLSVADKYRFLPSSKLFSYLHAFHPVDYLRTSESMWYEEGRVDSFVTNTQMVARQMGLAVKEAMMPVQKGEKAYAGPCGMIPGLTIERGSKRRTSVLSANVEKYATSGEVWVALPEHKIRKPIDSLVATATGLRRVSEIDPSLLRYADDRLKWLGSYLAKITLPSSVVRELSSGFDAVRRSWVAATAQRSSEHPLKRQEMTKDEMTIQIEKARNATIGFAYSKSC